MGDSYTDQRKVEDSNLRPLAGPALFSKQARTLCDLPSKRERKPEYSKLRPLRTPSAFETAPGPAEFSFQDSRNDPLQEDQRKVRGSNPRAPCGASMVFKTRALPLGQPSRDGGRLAAPPGEPHHQRVFDFACFRGFLEDFDEPFGSSLFVPWASSGMGASGGATRMGFPPPM
jgi:hypothetical protein